MPNMTPIIAHRSTLRRLPILFLALFALLWPAPPANAAKCAAEAYIIGAGRTYDQAARSGSAAAFANGVARYSDMRSIALFALGRYRKELPKGREGEYIALTKKFMGEFMLEYGKDFRVGTMQVQDCSGPPSNTLITARTSGGDKVMFRVAKSGGGWVVRDMNVSGIWLVQQLRSTFVGTISRANGNIDELFKYLKS